MRTYVWDDQAPYVAAFYTLVPYVVDANDDFSIPGDPLGGPLSGYLIAKLGIHQKTVGQLSQIGDDADLMFENENLLLVDALVRAGRASQFGGGRYAFIDATNEPDHILSAMRRVRFRPVAPANNPLHVVRLGRPSVPTEST